MSADALILTTLAGIVAIILALIGSAWRGIRNRALIHQLKASLTESEHELSLARDNQHALEQDNHTHEIKLSTLEVELANQAQRDQERRAALEQAAAQISELGKESKRDKERLADNQSDIRGLSVELEQTGSQHKRVQQELERLRLELEQATRRYSSLQNDHTQLQTEHRERESQHIEQIALLNENKEGLKKEFENLANRIFEDKGRSFTTTSKESMEALLKPFREQINGFQSRINEVHSESVKGNTALESEIKKVLEIGLEMNTQAANLSSALKGDKKTTGNWGEAQLERSLQLAGLQPGDHYDAQAAFKDDDGKRKLPDFVIKLPNSKHMVIDSKVSLVDYDRAIAAESEEKQVAALDAHALAVRRHIDDLSAKDYANLPDLGSPDFVLMFMPIEPAYIEAMKHAKDLFNYGYQKNVIMVSHSTLMPILRTVANLWMIDQSNKQAREISAKAGEIYNQVCVVAERFGKLGNTLQAANNHYNDAVRGLVGKQGLHGKVDRFKQLSAKASKELVTLEPLHSDLEIERLDTVVADSAEEGSPELTDDTPTTKH